MHACLNTLRNRQGDYSGEDTLSGVVRTRSEINGVIPVVKTHCREFLGQLLVNQFCQVTGRCPKRTHSEAKERYVYLLRF